MMRWIVKKHIAGILNIYGYLALTKTEIKVKTWNFCKELETEELEK